ncbi:UDP-glycosyltransferase-13 [Frankliniella occidentalis]|uniref:UDP-glucuronosyltransferase n=1 Tax=Frankliniella occidentalis TaxID=133901 RepID=A0A6J1S399_FRAOC|nr:UDP-glucosyltransferase 2 [Frankliniella occidentalis]KAE8749856.1 UDP-glycosyltransferase-13 [Frankliniella occidentalis]
MASSWSSGALAVLLMLAASALVVPPGAQAYRVLGMFPFNGRSHNIMFKALMEVLADRGHDVYMMSPFPQKAPRANYTDLDLSKEFPSLVNGLTYEQMTSFGRTTIVKLIGQMAGADLCRATFETQHFRDVMSGKHGKFDVVFTEIFGSDCFAAVAHKLKLPLISVVTAPDFPWMHERVGSIDNPSYIIAGMEPFAGRMNFLQKITNVFMCLYNKYMHKVYVNDPSDPVVREFFGQDTPAIAELIKNTSLIMVNSHVSVNPARPVNPNVINVGGLHLKDARPDRHGAGMDPDLRKWMDGAEHGVIFFTLGSLVRSSSLPKQTIENLIQAFGELPQRVLWKYETDDIKDRLPGNVRIASWMPQMEILAHHKTVLFITHGGLMGTTEAMFLGVPLLGIPLFADQMPNVELYRTLGIAERLDHTELTKDNVLTTIRKLTATDEYRVRAKAVAARYADRPFSAAEEAGWWTEYVIRHRGAPHLRPLGADLPLHQYLLLDVVALVLGAVIAVLLLLRAAVRALLGRTTTKTKQKKN